MGDQAISSNFEKLDKTYGGMSSLRFSRIRFKAYQYLYNVILI